MCPLPPQGHEQFVSAKVLEMAEKILKNLQKVMVGSTISTAAGLEKGSSYSAATYQAFPYPNHQAVPYYQFTSTFEVVDRNI